MKLSYDLETLFIKAFENVDNEVTPYAENKAKEIASYIESLNRVLTVEEIQDEIEKKLMASNRKDVAKCYILYRDERTRERRQSFLQGLSEGFYKALVFACAEIAKGRTPEEVYKDGRVSDLSPSVIEKFELPDDAEDIVGRW